MRICSRTWRCGVLTGVLVILVFTVRAFSFSEWEDHKVLARSEDDGQYEEPAQVESDFISDPRADDDNNPDNAKPFLNPNLIVAEKSPIKPVKHKPNRPKPLDQKLDKGKLRQKLRAGGSSGCSAATYGNCKK